MILENQHNNLENLSSAHTPISQKDPKKIYFHIGQPKSPIKKKIDLNSKIISQIQITNLSNTNNESDIRPKFTIMHNEPKISQNNSLPISSGFKFVTSKESFAQIKKEEKLNEENINKNKEININNINNENDINIVNNINSKKIKEIKLKKRKFKKFKIYHIEFKKLSEKEKIINKQNHKRKYKPDDIRKKIKARFHKSIKNIINENLRRAGSKKLFTYLPQVFISSITKEKNRNVLDLSFREILQKDFISEASGNKKYKNKNVDIAKYQRNISVLEYLDENPEICQNSGFDIISKMKYADLLDEYFRSEEFERAIYKLREENEDEEYIKEYIIKSKNYLNFFMDIPFKYKNNKFKVEEKSNKMIENE